jgi:ribosomal-protein-serine acetyltransferase
VSASQAFALPAGCELRELDEADADELHALIERNRARLAKWIHWAQDQTPLQTLAFIRRAREKARDGSGLHRCIVTDGCIVGVVTLSVDAANHSAAVGYWLDEACEGQGLVTAAVAGLVDDAFEHWRLNRVEIRAEVHNRPSRAVADRLGFQFEGVMRQAYRVGERYSDDAVYSLLASDPARRALASRVQRRDEAVEPTPRR